LVTDIYIPHYDDNRDRSLGDSYIAKYEDRPRSRSIERGREKGESYSYRDYHVRVSSQERERTRSPPPPSSSSRRNDTFTEEVERYDLQRRERRPSHGRSRISESHADDEHHFDSMSSERGHSRGKSRAEDDARNRRSGSEGVSTDENIAMSTKKASYMQKSWAPTKKESNAILAIKEEGSDALPTPDNTQRMNRPSSSTPDRVKRNREEKEERIADDVRRDKPRVVKLRRG